MTDYLTDYDTLRCRWESDSETGDSESEYPAAPAFSTKPRPTFLALTSHTDRPVLLSLGTKMASNDISKSERSSLPDHLVSPQLEPLKQNPLFSRPRPNSLVLSPVSDRSVTPDFSPSKVSPYVSALRTPMTPPDVSGAAMDASLKQGNHETSPNVKQASFALIQTP